MSICSASSAGSHLRRVALVAQAQVGRERVGADPGPLGDAAGARARPRRRRGRPSPPRRGATTVPMSRPSITASPSLGELALALAHHLAHRRVARDRRRRRGRCAAADLAVTSRPSIRRALVLEADRVLAGERAEPAASSRWRRARARATSARGTSRRCRGSGSRAARRAAARPCSCRPRRGRRWRRSSHRSRDVRGARRTRGSLQPPPRPPRSARPRATRARRPPPSIAIRWSPRASTLPPLRAGGDAHAPGSHPARGDADAKWLRAASFTVSMRSVSLTRSSCGARDDALAARQPARRARTSGSSSTSRGTSSGPTLGRDQLGGRTSRSATGSPPTVRRLKTAMRAPMRSSTSSKPVRVGLIPTPWTVSSEPGEQRRRDDERRGRREVAGDLDRVERRAGRRRATDAGGAGRRRATPAVREQPLRVVARGPRARRPSSRPSA